MCSHCKVQDHNVEQCPQLIAKWKARASGVPNPTQNPNLNVQMIVVELREPNIVVIT